MPSFLGSQASVLLVSLSGVIVSGLGCSSPEVPDEIESLGSVSFATSCDATVQADFNRAVALLHHMTYPVAEASFREIAEEDPDCAMAYWGMAMTLFQPLWPTRPGESKLERGQELMLEARARVSAGSREAQFVATGEAFFDPSGAPDYWTRIERWAGAVASTYEANPEDPEAAVLYGLAQLATSARSSDPAGQNARAAAVLSEVLALEPTHPGAVHYTIHANDFDGRERESLEVVRSYGEIAPQNPHALHMPTHIFVRLGEWAEVIRWNERAAETALEQRVGDSDEYVWDEFPHAVEYLVYAHLQMGDDEEARRLIYRLEVTPDLQPSFKTAFHLASTAARFALERQDWEGATQLSAREPANLDWDRFPWPEAVVWHARGLGAAHRGDLELVGLSRDQLAALAARAAESGETLFTSQIRILELEVEAQQRFAEGNEDLAVTLLNRAASLEASTPKHPVTPGATIPANELIGNMYLAIGDAGAAREAFLESNRRVPGRLNTLLGLARASLALGDSPSATAYYEQVVATTAETSRRSGVAEARAFLDGA
jgi:tetratricopeptide (TPR) repeat protein